MLPPDPRNPDSKTVRIQNNTPHEVRIVSIEITGNARLAKQLGEAWDKILQPGEEDSVTVASRGSLWDGRFDLKVHWEKIIRTRVTRTEFVEVPPDEPEAEAGAPPESEEPR